MSRYLVIALLFIPFGCEQVIGLDDFEEGEEVEDEGEGQNTGGEEIPGEGEPCAVNIIDVIEMEGECIPQDAPADHCPGGTYPIDQKGTCPSDEPLKCCVGVDQCERFAPATYCQPEECEGVADGWTMGCPDGQWCCSDW
ncbi:MAG: hypothetical protein GY847_06240 [Proteobacteria bacterium]|nr:hypothetical protein [Pseudomonadota bacterium]